MRAKPGFGSRRTEEGWGRGFPATNFQTGEGHLVWFLLDDPE